MVHKINVNQTVKHKVPKQDTNPGFQVNRFLKLFSVDVLKEIVLSIEGSQLI